MRLKYYSIILLLAVACVKPKTPASIGDITESIFNDANLYFDINLKKQALKPDSNGILRLDAGRILLKKVKLPNYQLQPNVTVNVTLTSNGDPWDKSGSLFVIPSTADLNMLSFSNEAFLKEQLKDSFPGVVSKTIKDSTYMPNVELLRFMTPFGVGYFSNNERAKKRKPPYIPHWENEVNWSQNVTHLLPLLEDEVYIGVYIDTWTKQGYNISVSINYKESNIPNHIKKEQTVLPIVNTVKYNGEQVNYDGFSKESITVRIPADDAYKNAKLYYIATGHGGHAKGDEFVKKENIISLDDNVIKQFAPWRDDCASFRRFNPTSGTWVAKDFMEGETSNDHIASSDLSRSNWCPGSDVVPEVIALKHLGNNPHTFKFSIPEAQEAKENEHNYWMVSAYIIYDNE
ncbi:PNGase F N-terminal domain-containing protein [Pontimicrobium sp. MEBiC01747]